MVTEKTTLQKLTDLVQPLAEIIEKLEAQIAELEEKIADRDEKITDFEDEFDNSIVCDMEIDFGVGKLHYKKPDNLKVEMFMETVMQKFQGHTFQS